MSEIELTREHIPENIRVRVFIDIGQASMCWESPEHAGIFDDKQASEIATSLCQFVVAEIKKAKEKRRNEEAR